jgi:hypothetical protein
VYSHQHERGSTVSTPEADKEATAFLQMARKLRHAQEDREKAARPYRERYDRSHDDLRMSPAKRVKVAAEFLRAAHHADHVYEERIEEGLEEYRQMIVAEDENARGRAPWGQRPGQQASQS